MSFELVFLHELTIPLFFFSSNPKVPQQLKVDLVHTMEHSRYAGKNRRHLLSRWRYCCSFFDSLQFFFSVVCCVRFSADGKYLATGCNRSAQIYDIQTGQTVWYANTDVF